MIDIFFIIFQVIILDGILSIDNAAALAGIAETLPKKPAPLSDNLKKYLGSTQREAALRVGILGAYVGRGLMLVLAGWFLSFEWFKLLGAAYLLYLVGTHFLNFPALFNFNFKGLSNFWKTVIMIEIADLAFSLDNVAAVVAISQNIVLIVIGVFISIIFMRFAAQIFMKMIEVEPSLEHAAFVLIAAIAIELILKFFHIDVSSIMQFSVSMAILLAFITYGQMSKRLRGGEAQ